ncbi:MAG: Crp/Fnr family transcriptional regulator [Rhizobiales bacterium]|nr:Crp/Fnr family transcriptional regulator [Hyphomicrobiales bacterium]
MLARRALPSSSGSALKYPCEQCPIRGLKVFRPFTAEELGFVASFKAGELVVDPRATILQEGTSSTHLFTVLIGWAFRYKMLPDGRRQILNFALPGDFLGLQASMFNEMTHSVEALTSMTLCVFPRERIWELYEHHASLSFDVTWLAAREEQILDSHLLNVGRRNAIERTAYLILHLFMRARDVGLAGKANLALPITQQHLADTLGMSIVHTNKTLRRLYDRKLISWKSQRLEILDMEALKEIAEWDGESTGQLRPLI